MARLLLIFAALLAYLGIVGCALMTADASPTAATVGRRYTPASYPTTSPDGLPYRSITLQLQRTDWTQKYEKAIDQIAEVGADSVKFVVDARQENGRSSQIYLDLRKTPSVEMLTRLIRHARQRHLRVILMPIVLLDKPRGNEWRGKIEPENWEDWWQSYRDMLNHYAWISEGNGVDIFVIGSELVSTEKDLDEWTHTINDVRARFKGKLTYSANWDHYQNIPFWDQLDVVSMNSYWKLGEDSSVTVPQIEQNWQKIVNELHAFSSKSGKPILFSEVGWCSMSNAASEPWDYTTGDPIDDALQKRLYQAFFNVWHGKQWFAGYSIWEWDVEADASDRTTIDEQKRGYTPRGKPAEAVLRKWINLPWDKSQPE